MEQMRYNLNFFKFWKHYFPGKETVQNEDFQVKIEELLKMGSQEEDGWNQSKQKRKLFAKAVTEQIFWPLKKLQQDTDTTKQNKAKKQYDPPNFVDRDCVKFAMKTFGQWPVLFQNIYKNLCADDQPVPPLDFFFGHTRKDIVSQKIVQAKCPFHFLLKYDDERGLQLLWGKPSKKIHKSVTVSQVETIRRRILKKDKREVWTWSEKIAEPGSVKRKNRDFPSICAFIDFMKGGPSDSNLRGAKQKIQFPILISSTYHPSSQRSEETKEEVNDNYDQ